MSEKVIRLSENAVKRIKEIMSNAEDSTIGVGVGVKKWRMRRDVLCNGICKRNKTKRRSNRRQGS